MAKRTVHEILDEFKKPEPTPLDVLNEALDALEADRGPRNSQREDQEMDQVWQNKSRDLVLRLCLALAETLKELQSARPINYMRD